MQWTIGVYPGTDSSCGLSLSPMSDGTFDGWYLFASPDNGDIYGSCVYTFDTSLGLAVAGDVFRLNVVADNPSGLSFYYANNPVNPGDEITVNDPTDDFSIQAQLSVQGQEFGPEEIEFQVTLSYVTGSTAGTAGARKMRRYLAAQKQMLAITYPEFVRSSN